MNNPNNTHNIVADPDEKLNRGKLYDLYAMTYLEERPSVYFHGILYTYHDKAYRPEMEPELTLGRWLQDNNIKYTNAVITNTVPQIKAMCWQDNLRHPTMPYFMDESGRKAANYIPFQNGLLNMDAYCQGTVQLESHTEDFVCSYVLPYDFDQTATCPRWLQFVDEIFQGDADRISLLQEWFGYCLTSDTARQKFMTLVGQPRSGKGTVSNTLIHLVGLENYAAFDLLRLVDRFSVSVLTTHQLATVGEVELNGCKDKARILEKLKSWTGNDPFPIERKGVNLEDSRPLLAKLLMSCNTMPLLHDPSGALVERMLVLNFNRTFAGQEDHDLINKLLVELSGIALWALHGLKKLRASGWTAPASSSLSLGEFRRDSAHHLAFLQDCLRVRYDWLNALTPHVAPLNKPQEFVRRRHLEIIYGLWAQENGYDPDKFNWIARDLRVLFPHMPLRERTRINGKQLTVYSGFALTDYAQEVFSAHCNNTGQRPDDLY